MTDSYHYEKKKDQQTMIETNGGKRPKEQFIENLREGDVVNDFFAVKIKNPPRPYKKGVWFDFVAIDKSGEIGVKYWGGENKDRVKRLFDSFSQGDVIQVRSGYVEVYEGRMQISINETTGGLRRCSPREYDISDFIPALEEKRIEELYEYIEKQVASVQDEALQSLLKMFFDDQEFVNEFKHSPSAISHHHNYIGGNLEHTVGVIRLCTTICEMYPGANRDLVIAGGILHDIGKFKEYRVGAAVEKTDEGNFIGHIVIGDRWIREKITELREKGTALSQTLENQLAHIILSHHGRYDWGSPRMPKTIEACIVHQADLMDSQVKNFMQNIEDTRKTTEDEWVPIYDSEVGKKRMMYLGTR